MPDGTDLTPYPDHGDAVDAVIVDDTPRLPALPDDSALTASAAERIRNSWSPSTRTGYDRDWENYTRWCAHTNRTPAPATTETVASYADHLAGAGMAPSTIDRALGAISSRHEALTSTKAPMKGARMVLRQYRKECAQNGLRTKQALALAVEQLRSMLEAAGGEDLRGMRDRALLLLGYGMMARRSELANLNVEDVSFVDDGLEVYIASSKTDKDAAGALAPIPYGTHRLTCAVRTTRAWVDALAAAGVTEGPLLRNIDRHGRLAGTPGAAGYGTARMSGAGVNLIVKRLADQVGIEGVTAHSLRAGPATAAATNGSHRAWIARQGRWSEKSTAVDGYIRPADMWVNHPLRSIGL